MLCAPHQKEAQLELENKVAVVTAAGSGIGRASSRRLARAGAAVAVADLNGEAAEETVRLITEEDGTAWADTVDCGDSAAVERFMQHVGERYGRVDVLFNNAGIPNRHGVLEVTEEDWSAAINVNLKSGFFATKFALPLMTRSGEGGTIVFTASTAGLVASATSPLYAMTKHGVVGLVKALAYQLADQGIRVNAVCPGPVKTPMLPGFMDKGPEAADEVAAQYGGNVPLKRVAQPEEVAECVLFLASPASSYVTGIAMPVDGGFIAY
jgi:NAD(P)-dependent dehydrogenase (short-subunit alcohol dehydrogenase family)